MSGPTERNAIKIDDLLQASAFSHPVSEIRLLETHISYVILTGPWAYKIKKPVQFEFVDYSSLPLRKRYCDLELELNRRFAPELYEEVVPIWRDQSGNLRLAGSHDEPVEGQPVEYAVKMRQFPQSAIVARRLHNPELTAAAVEQFGRDIARFHAGLKSAPTALPCVQVDRIWHDAHENFAVVGEMPVPHEDFVTRLTAWTRQQFEELQPLFQRRLEQGLVRLCHGDMHLKNVLQLQGRLIPFDGIEFNEEFQWIDVYSELAFPVMDFVARGRPDLGWRMLNAWLEETGDYGGLAVLRFYLVYRALVRAKVSWLNPANHVRDDHSRAPDWEKYLKAARFFALDLQPSLTITHGLSGSGKSTVSRLWIDVRGGVRLRSDVVRTQLEDPLLAGPARYRPQALQRVYDRLREISRDILQAGLPVVVDATFLQRQRRQKFQELACEMSVDWGILDCQAPDSVLRQRIRDRRGDASEATLAVLDQQIRTREPLDPDECQVASRTRSRCPELREPELTTCSTNDGETDLCRPDNH